MSNRTLLARARELAHKSPTLSSSQAHAAVVHVIVRDQSPPNCEYHALLFDIEHLVAKNGPNLAALVALQYGISSTRKSTILVGRPKELSRGSSKAA